MSRAVNLQRLGPFTGGVNTYSDPAFILDDELVDLINMEVGFDKVLRSRPPMVELVSSHETIPRFNIIGLGSFGTDGKTYLIGSDPGANNANDVFVFDITNGGTEPSLGWVSAGSSSGVDSKVAILYAGEFWIIPSTFDGTDTGPYNFWHPNTITVGTTGPRGDTAVLYKDRLFVAKGSTVPGLLNGSRLYWSEPGDPDNFLSTSFVDVASKDGSNIIALAVYQDSVVIFKQHSTWQLTYDTDPAKGSLRNVNETIGTDNYKCIAQYENSVFVYQGNTVYEMVNFQFIKLNPRTPFDKGRDLPTGNTYIYPEDERHLSVVGDRLLCRYFGNTYVHNLRTRTWSRWVVTNSSEADIDIQFRNWFADWWKSPILDENGLEVYYAALGVSGMSYASTTVLLRIKDGYTKLDVEEFSPTLFQNINSKFDIECTVLSKEYDLETSFNFKAIKWWGANIMSNRDVNSKLVYQGDGEPITWNTLEGRTWDQWNGTPYWVLEGPGKLVIADTKDVFMNNVKGHVRFEEPAMGSLFQFLLMFTTDGSTTPNGGVVLLHDIILAATPSVTAPGKVT